ncbi:MAG: extensin family protein [Rhizobiales bacterium]|nr:extensin family protein [Hyphomicrobiales bacterium]
MLVSGCAFNFLGERRESWREQAERACMAQKPQSYFVRPVREIKDKGSCGVEYPLAVAALQAGTIGIGPDATLGCPITTALEYWMRNSVQPASIAYFGMPIVEIKQISAYSCRTRNSKKGAELSEHAFGNAIDVAGFVLADGRVVTVKSGWNGKPDERAFLREVFTTACASFNTTLGPGAAYHGDHFHVDLARHNDSGTYKYCKPRLSTPPPARPPYDGELYAAIPGQPRYDLMMSATAYSGEARAPLSRMPEQVLITDVPPSYADSPFFSAIRGVEIREAGDAVMDE